ncbi:hypothetical protein [Streptomyces goshikiensis]|uniref:hypothetical protein n=1 Tax=Streptomyces goshikiensis TaxID=1942 RepID=UPI001AE136F0|nr:hypothetical protein [Streptomyces sp. KCTC 0041BP]
MPVLSEACRDLCIHGGDLFVQSQDRPGQRVHHGCGCALPGHGGVLGLGRGYGRIGHGLGARPPAEVPGTSPQQPQKPTQPVKQRLAEQIRSSVENGMPPRPAIELFIPVTLITG